MHAGIKLYTPDPPYCSGGNLLAFLLLNSTVDPFSHPTTMSPLISLSYLPTLYKFENSPYQGCLILFSHMPIPFALGLHWFVLAATYKPWNASPLLCPRFNHTSVSTFSLLLHWAFSIKSSSLSNIQLIWYFKPYCPYFFFHIDMSSSISPSRFLSQILISIGIVHSPIQ